MDGAASRDREMDDETICSCMRPMKVLSLRWNFAWTLAGNIIYTCCQWGTLVVLAKLGSPEAVGQFALGLAVTAPVIMFANLQLRAVLATDAKGEYHFGEYLALRLLTVVASVVIIYAIIIIAGFSSTAAMVILAVGAAKMLESVSDIYYGLVQRHERMDRIAISMIVKGVLSLGVVGVVFHFTRSVFWMAIGMAVAWGIVLILYDIPSGRFILRQSSSEKAPGQNLLLPRLRRTRLLQLARLSAPLGVVMLLISLNTNVPRYFIEHYWGERSLGIFAAMSYLIVAGTTVVSALGQSAVPRLATNYAEGSTGFRSLLAKLLVIGGALGCAGVAVAFFCGRWLLTVLYGHEYGVRHDVLTLIAVGAAITYIGSFLGYGITSARYFKVQVPLLVVVCLVMTVGCLLLVPKHGLTGAALAIVISTTVQTIGSAVVAAHACSRLTASSRKG